MTRKQKNSASTRSLQIETLNHRIMLDAAGFIDPVFYGPSPYQSEADTPAGFVPVADCDECVLGLETFEDGTLDFGLQIDEGQVIGPGFSTGSDNLTDSVDGDDGIIDGTGQTGDGGFSYFSFGNTFTVQMPSLMQSAGLVWTDGDPAITNVIFEAFDENGNSLGTVEAGAIADDSFMGTTGEDRFFGVSYGDGVTTGVTSIQITNVGGLGIEIDHIQFANCSECCEIDLELTKTVDATVVEEGDVLTWTIEISNNEATATEAATGVQIGDVLPAGLTVVGAGVTNGTFSPGTGIWALNGALEPGESETLTVQTIVDAGLSDGQMIVNTAQVIAANENDVDSTPNNDDGTQSEDDEASAKVTVQVNEPVIDLELNKDVDVDVVNAGDTATWTVSVTNNEANATAAATGVTIADVLPAGISVVSVTPSGSGVFAGDTWTLVDPLAPGQSATLTVVTTIDAGLAGGAMLVNTAYVATANETDFDSTPGDTDLVQDDADDAKVTIKELIDLELTKVIADTSGNEITWVVSLTNDAIGANAAATGVLVEDVLPAGVTFVDAITTGDSSFSDGIWTINESIEPGETLTLTLVAAIDDDLPSGAVVTNVAQVTAADQMDVDSVPDNDNGDQSEDDEAAVQFVVPSAELLMLSGHAYVDTNNDGVFQSNELPLLGVEIQLMGTDLGGNSVNLTTFTNLEGAYKFNDLQPGTYMVTQTQPVQFVDGRDTLGNLGGDDTVNDKFTVVLDANATDYDFGELGLLPEYVNKRLYLTSTPYTDWQYIDVRQSSIWYSFDVAHQAFLEANAQVGEGGSAVVEIFDADMNLVGSQSFGTSGEAGNAPVLLQGDGQFFMQVSGDVVVQSLSLVISSPSVNVSGNQLIAVGTAGNDNIQLQLGSEQHVLDINGLIYEFAADVVTDLHIGAATGNDSVTIIGTELDEVSSAIGTSGSLSSVNYQVHTYSFDQTTFVGGGGYDYSQVYGSLGDDKLDALPEDTKLTTPDTVLHVLGYDRVDAYGRGGWDYASLYGTQGADNFVATESYSLLGGHGHLAYTKGFERVDAFGRGGMDTATLFDSSGDDVFVSNALYSLMSTGTRLSYTKGFELVTAKAVGGGHDVARFNQLVAGDSFVAAADEAKIATVAGRDDRAVGFDAVFAAGEDFDVFVDDFNGLVHIDN